MTPHVLTAAALVGAALLLAACTSAASPDRIQPAYVSSLSFQKMSCRQLAAAKANNDRRCPESQEVRLSARSRERTCRRRA